MFRILDEIARAMISGKCLFLRGFWFCTARAVGSGRSRNARRTLRPHSSIRNPITASSGQEQLRWAMATI